MKLIYIVLVFYEKYMTLIASIVFLRFVLLYMLHFIILLRILLKGQCRKRLAGTSNLFLPHIEFLFRYKSFSFYMTIICMLSPVFEVFLAFICAIIFIPYNPSIGSNFSPR
jgi:hypothetical protein